VIAAALMATTAVFGGHTTEARPLQVEVARGRVTRVKGSVLNYTCDSFGDVGPVRFDLRVRTRVDSRGRFSFVTGDRVERVGVAGHVRSGDGAATGRVRVSGTIATGQRCASPVVRFRLVRRTAG
jgi:hypothetical protein